MRYAQIVERVVPPEQIAALVEAARLLQERGEPWPPLVGEVLQRVVEEMERSPRVEAAETEPKPEPEGEVEAAVAGLTRFRNAFRRGGDGSDQEPDRS